MNKCANEYSSVGLTFENSISIKSQLPKVRVISAKVAFLNKAIYIKTRGCLKCRNMIW